MATITPPKYVRQVLIALQSHGHLAYLVGGCVRDIILGVHPQDWDVCTSAFPEQVLEIFPNSITTGIRHGTVTVRVNSRFVEVTTFRTDGSYADHRHPDAVSFVGDLNADLARRDFTMNAIALPPDGLIADPFGGIEDIQNKTIRCVGTPELRFEEDALRMFRALRFSARLGFEIEPQTMAAIEKKAPLAASLTAERVRDEIEKLLMTSRPEMLSQLISLGLMDAYLIRRPSDYTLFSRLGKIPHKALQRWCALCTILIRYDCISSAQDFLTRLRLDGRTVRCCTYSAIMLQGDKPATRAEWKRALNRYGTDSVICAALCYDMLHGGQCHKELKTVLKSDECFSMKHLAVTGNDLLELGLKGKEVGEMLRFLLDYVIEYPDNNRRELLLSLAKGTEE